MYVVFLSQTIFYKSPPTYVKIYITIFFSILFLTVAYFVSQAFATKFALQNLESWLLIAYIIPKIGLIPLQGVYENLLIWRDYFSEVLISA